MSSVEEIRRQVEARLSQIKADEPNDDLMLSWMDKVMQQLEFLDEGLKDPTYVFLRSWRSKLPRMMDLLQALAEMAALCRKRERAQDDVNDAKAWVEEMGEVPTSVPSELPDWIWPWVYYLVPAVCVIFLPNPLPDKPFSPDGSAGVGSEAVGLQIISGILWPLFGLLWVLGTLVGLAGAASMVGRILLGLLIDAGIRAGRRAMAKSDETSLDARKREKNDRSGKVSEASSALSAIERSIREKDRRMKEIFESLFVKDR